MIDIQINRVKHSRHSEVDFSNLVFGKEFSDHIFIADYDGISWGNFRIQPYGPLSLSPSLSCMHYGQAIFEGMKAYKTEKNEIQIFRPYDNFMRLNESAERMCMPAIPEHVFMEGLKTLCRLDEKWVSSIKDNALYLRPFMIASDDSLGIRPSTNYMFMIYGCAVGGYYSEPLKVKVETHYVRSCKGGVGEAKTAGNYAAALYATRIAQNEGYHQVLWMDANEHKYLEELGSSNLFILQGTTLITPATSGTVLKGVTRQSVIQLANSMGYIIQERAVSIDEVLAWYNQGCLDELFATGTAASIIPIAQLQYKDQTLIFKQSKNSLANRLSIKLDNIKRSKEDDVFGWNTKVDLLQSAGL